MKINGGELDYGILFYTLFIYWFFIDFGINNIYFSILSLFFIILFGWRFIEHFKEAFK